MERWCRLVSVLMLLAASSACVKPAEYGLFREHMPRSILVLPPRNNSIEVNASYVYLSTVTEPLAEMGYYVFPVAVVDAFMKDNGLPTPYEMHSVSHEKLREVFNADAVLYLEIEEWGQKYQILNSSTVVEVEARLVDLVSGEELWRETIRASENSSSAAGGRNALLAMVISAAVEQVIDSSSSRIVYLARDANARFFRSANKGLLFGPRHPDFESDTRGRESH